MAINHLFGSDPARDPALNAISVGLGRYLQMSPKSQIDLYRQDKYTVRLRVIDPRFEGMPWDDRHESIWKHLQDLPGDAGIEVYPVICLAPSEIEDDVSNFWFEHPKPSERLSA